MLKKLCAGILGFAIAAFIIGCGGGSEEATKSKPQTTPTKGTQVASGYICPMKCEGSASDKPGKCPKCGMDLVKVGEAAGGSATMKEKKKDKQKEESGGSETTKEEK